MSYLSLPEAARYVTHKSGIELEPSALLRMGALGHMLIVAYFDGLMRNLTTHEDEEILGHLIVPLRHLAAIENEGQAKITGAHSLDGKVAYSPQMTRTREQLRVLVSELDRIIPSLSEPAAPSHSAVDTPSAEALEVDGDEIRALWELANVGELIASGHFTVLQCSQLAAATMPTGVTPLSIHHFYKMALVDIAHQRLNPKHPETFIRYSEYLEMIGNGAFGQNVKDFPLPTAAWLLTINDAQEWLESKGFSIDFDTMKANVELLRNRSQPQPTHPSDEKQSHGLQAESVNDAPATKRVWDSYNLRRLWDESKEAGVTHAKLAQKYGVSRPRIGALLKKAREDFAPKQAAPWDSLRNRK